MFWQSRKTFKPQKKAAPGTRRFELHKHASATLGAGNLEEAVKLPPGEDLYDWLAVNVTDFYNEISLLYGVLMDTCTPISCPVMSAGPKFEYKWADGLRIKKPVRCSAPKYIDYMMSWVQASLDDEKMFPIRMGEPFPPNIRDVMRSMFKRLFRVYAHMYICHFQAMQQMGAEPHLNTCFRHFMLFVQEFDLIDPQELAPLQTLIKKLVLDRSGAAVATAAGSSAVAGPADAAANGASSSCGAAAPPTEHCQSCAAKEPASSSGVVPSAA